MMEEIELATGEIAAGAKLTSNGCIFSSRKKIKVAIIGAGFTGLCAARHVCSEGSGMTGVVFEQTSNIGGTWVYTDATGKDKFGVSIHSNLYHDLWTNLPKEVMEFPDFKYKDNQKSYLHSSEVLQYLHDYAEHFNLSQHIKLNHLVKCVAPLGNSWSVSAVDLVSNIEHVSIYDAVMVCSGSNIIPVYPKLEGFAKFSGRQLHSKEFRRASAFAGKRVLIIGLGPSGIDIAYKLIGHAEKLIVSHNKGSKNKDQPVKNKKESPVKMKEIKGVTLKPEVVFLEDKTVTFVDGTIEDVDVIIYCTGYTYHYPFLTKDCGITVDQCVYPLYLHFINIEHPTMGLFGIPRPVPHQYMVDYQIRTFIKILKGDVQLCEKMHMEKEIEDQMRIKCENLPKKYFHRIKSQEEVFEFFNQLSELGQLDPVPTVLIKAFFDAFRNAIRDFEFYRKSVYKFVDDENFVVINPTVDAHESNSIELNQNSQGGETDENKDGEESNNNKCDQKTQYQESSDVNCTQNAEHVQIIKIEQEKVEHDGENELEAYTKLNEDPRMEDDVTKTEMHSELEKEDARMEDTIARFAGLSSEAKVVRNGVETIQVKAIIEKYKYEENIEPAITINEDQMKNLVNSKDSHENGIVNIVRNVECHKKDVD